MRIGRVLASTTCSTPASPRSSIRSRPRTSSRGERASTSRSSSPRARVRTHHGFAVPVAPPAARAPDLAIVPALACKQPGTILAALARPDVTALVDAVAALREARHPDRGRVHRHVRARPRRRARRPARDDDLVARADVPPAVPRGRARRGRDARRDERVLTAGAALAHVDLALAVIRERSPDLAATRRALPAARRAAVAGAVRRARPVAHDDELVKRFERWIRKHLNEPFELAKAARAVGASERTLQRRVRAVLGKPPIGFVQDLRLERAVHLLRATQDSVDDIATRASATRTARRCARCCAAGCTGVRELRAVSGRAGP